MRRYLRSLSILLNGYLVKVSNKTIAYIMKIKQLQIYDISVLKLAFKNPYAN